MNNPYFSLVGALWRYGKKWRLAIVGYYLALIMSQICLSLSPYAFGRAIDTLQHFEIKHLQEIAFWLLMSVAVALLFWLFHGPARLVERRVALSIQQTFRLKLYEDLTHLPLKWHQDHHSGNILTRINRSAAALHRFSENQFIYIQTIIKFLTSIGFLLWISLPVGLINLLTAFILITILLLFDKKLIPLYNTENEIDNHVGSLLFDYINNMTTVLTLRLGTLTHSNVFQRMMSVWPFFKKEVLLNETKWFTMMLLLSLIQTAILLGYIIYTANTTHALMIGLVVMIFRYQYDLNDVFFTFSAHYSEVVKMDTDVKGINPILDDINRLAHLPPGMTTAQQWQTLEIKNLAFHHAPGETRGHIFKRINFKLKRGEKVALIGSSGAGKSTLLNLLCGLYTPSTVSLNIDNTTFETLEPLQSITTLIPQDPEIFENTIAFNITMDLPTNQEELQRIIKLAGFSKVLTNLPHGIHTDIREKGLNLSVGQKQRLALARGLFAARYSSLILMDEPTSSVDLLTEKEILTGVMNALPESTLIVSLHRLHLLPHFDSVIMLHEGEVVANGSIAQLLNTPGPVRDLWQDYQEH